MQVELYQNSSVHNRLIKTMTLVKEFTAVQVNDNINDFEIQIKISGVLTAQEWSKVNYMRVVLGSFPNYEERFYFVDDLDRPVNGMTVVNGKLDLLATYATAIRALKVRAVRSTSHGDPQLQDDLARLTARATPTVYEFPQGYRIGSNGSYVLITAQQGYTPVGT